MFIPKELLQSIVFATIIGIFIVIGFAIYSPKTSFDACVDTYVENEIASREEAYESRNVKVPKLTKDRLNNFRDVGFYRCRGLK
tara:strand:- start:275 stop:526 length:252 start_codon:yes stop_codon:yes gene_type:complete